MEVLLKRDAEEAGLEAPPPRELLLKTREEHATRHILAEGDGTATSALPRWRSHPSRDKDALAIYGIVEQKMDMQAKMGPEVRTSIRMSASLTCHFPPFFL